MFGEILSVLTLLYGLALLVAPGSLLAFSPLGRLFSPGLRIAAAVVFSPLVMSGEIVVATLAGLPFDRFVQAVAPANLLGLVPLLLGLRRLRRPGRAWPLLALVLLLILPVFGFLFTAPYFREYGWHNMMQTAAIQQFQTLPRLPEEMDLAGARLNYPWLGFAQLATIGAVVNLPAIVLFPIINLVNFACMFVFLDAAARRLGAAPPVRTALATAIVLLSPGVVDIAAAVASAGPAFPPLGELRIEPMIAKFGALDTMVMGLSSLAVLVYAVIAGLAGVDVIAVLLLASLACGIAYPLLFPSCAVIVGLFGLAMLAARRWPRLGLPVFRTRRIVLLALGFGVVTALFASYILVIGTSAATHPVRLALRWEVRRHLTRIGFVFGPLILVLLALAPGWLRARRVTHLVPAVMFAALLGCFAAIAMPVTAEYKFLFAGLLVIVPVLAAELAALTSVGMAGLAGLAAALVPLLLAATWSLWHWQEPPGQILAHAVPLDQTTRLVHPLAGWDGSWMQAVRDATPPDTVLLVDDTDQPVAVFTDRSLYVAADWFGRGRPDGDKVGRVGYSMDQQMILVDVKGYPPAEVVRRVQLLRRSFAAQADPDALDADLAALAALHRPVALYFTGATAMRAMLRTRGLGRAVFEAGPDLVWLVSAAELAGFAATVHADATGR